MKNWKAILGVVLVFLLGSAAGGLVTMRCMKKRIERVVHGEPMFTADEVVRHMSRRLRLDAAQRDQIRAIVVDTQAQMSAVRKQCQPQVRAVIDEAIAKTRPILRPDQLEKFDKFIAERRRAWQDHREP
jgi:uncharacterized protein YneF (UPF0154 family)